MVEKVLGLDYVAESFIDAEDNEGGQTGEQADPPSRTLVHRAMSTVGSWEYISIPTPSTSQTSQPAGAKGLVRLTFQRFDGSFVPCPCDLGFFFFALKRHHDRGITYKENI